MEGLTPGAELYALLHRGTPGDVAFYRAACRGAHSVLELGCGHGRVLLPLARDGHRVTGVDVDPGLLALCGAALDAEPAARERTTVHRADMRDVALGARFERVIIPYNGLYCLASEREQVACLANAARHLAPGGRVVFDGYAIDAFHLAADTGEAGESEERVARVRWRATRWDVYERCAWDRPGQRLHVAYRFQPRDRSAPVHQRVDHRYLLTGDLAPICASAGLEAVALAGGFHGEPLTGDSEHLVCVARALRA